MRPTDSAGKLNNASENGMAFRRNSARTNSGITIPDEMYIGFVDRHLVDMTSLVLASLVVIVAQIVAVYSPPSPASKRASELGR